MTAADAPPPPPPPPTLPPPAFGVRVTVPPAAPRTPASGASVAAFVLIVATWALYLVVKILVPIFDAPAFKNQVDTIAAVFGVLGFVSLVPIALGIVFGHRGLRRNQRGKRGRMLGILALAGGYLLLLLFLNRILVAAIALIAFPDGANFLQNTFYWA